MFLFSRNFLSKNALWNIPQATQKLHDTWHIYSSSNQKQRHFLTNLRVQKKHHIHMPISPLMLDSTPDNWELINFHRSNKKGGRYEKYPEKCIPRGIQFGNDVETCLLALNIRSLVWHISCNFLLQNTLPTLSHHYWAISTHLKKIWNFWQIFLSKCPEEQSCLCNLHQIEEATTLRM